MSHRLSNPKCVRDKIRRLARKREWQDFPVSERIVILEQVSEIVEKVLQEAQ